MAIRFTKYIDIVSAVGAATVVATRELIGRLFTNNELLPPQSFIEFTNADQVADYFGDTSEEFLRAQFYFSFISKNITAADKISFARWVDASVAPKIFGGSLTLSLTALKAITNGSFSLTLGGITHVLSALDFSGAANLAAIATILQVAIRAADVSTQWASATVTFDVTRNSFDLVGGNAVAANVSVAAGNVGTNISNSIGWLPESVNGGPGAIWCDGSLFESITSVLTDSAAASNNFGSFLFIPALNLTQITEAATWNNSQNNLFMYMVPVDNLTDAITYNAALANLAGVAVTLAPLATEYDEMAPMMQLAATNYDARNSTINYMFQILALTPKVTDDATSDALDALRVNYYGVTQTAGQLLAFYQRGLLMGLANSPSDMNTYANEQWLKDAIGAQLMTLLLALGKISANDIGRSQILAGIQTIILAALTNGTISANSAELSTAQKLFITQVTGDPNAFYQVQTIGYWVDAVITSFVADGGNVEFKINYTLVYKKDDVIRKVEGQDILI